MTPCRLPRWLNTLRLLIRRFYQEGFTYRAAALAYGTVLALVPLCIVSLAVLSYFPNFQHISHDIQTLIVQNFIPSAAQQISQYIQPLLTHLQSVSHGTLIFLLGVELYMLFNIRQAFNAAWRTKARTPHLLTHLLYTMVLIVAPIFLGGVLVLFSFAFKLFSHFGRITTAPVWQALFMVLPYIITWLTFSVFNRVLPTCPVHTKDALKGGAITAALFELAKIVFAGYLARYSTYQVIYGAVAVLPIFLIWLYVSWLIILFGALMTHHIAQNNGNHR